MFDAKRLRAERIVWDPGSAEDLRILRDDVARVADDMDDPGRPPPMFWSGIPWPEPGPEPSCDYQLVVSLGGTKTDFALLRLEAGRVLGLDVLSGREVEGPEEIDRVKSATQMPTPAYGPHTPTGQAMVRRIVENLAPHVESRREAFERCEAIYLSWGFPHKVIRTGEKIAGGLSARVTKMTKDQAGFTESLLGCEIGGLFAGELERRTGWSRPVAVANDTVMALHYFLAPSRRKGHASAGLFIVGTGTNFSAAEPYAIRPEGYVSRPGEDYVPERITAKRPLRKGETEARFFVNYEAGSTELVATKTRFDVEVDYPIERNALAGGNAFSQQLRSYVETFVSKSAYEKLLENWRRASGDPESLPAGPAVSRLVAGDAAQLLDGLASEEEAIGAVAQAIAERSALHAAIVLAAVTLRTGFGRGDGKRTDLLGMEGSVWKTPGYPERVRAWWTLLSGGRPLAVEFAAEPSYNASLPGPLYLAAIHR
ncbi:MAG: hypothetical protein ACUVYA_06745 [Planctomycetota bacterium]